MKEWEKDRRWRVAGSDGEAQRETGKDKAAPHNKYSRPHSQGVQASEHGHCQAPRGRDCGRGGGGSKVRGREEGPTGRGAGGAGSPDEGAEFRGHAKGAEARSDFIRRVASDDVLPDLEGDRGLGHAQVWRGADFAGAAAKRGRHERAVKPAEDQASCGRGARGPSKLEEKNSFHVLKQ